MLQTEKVHRVTVDFSEEAYIALEQLSNDLKTTKADILRRSLGLMRFVVEETNNGANFVLENPKTKEAARLLKDLSSPPKTLFLLAEKNPNLELGVRNLPGANVLLVDGLNVYDLLAAQRIVCTPQALKKIEERLA